MNTSPKRKFAFASSATLALAIAASGLIAPANAADSNVVPDAALRSCINNNINNWAKKWNLTEKVGVRTSSSAVTRADMENYLSKTGSLECKNSVSSLEGMQYANGLISVKINDDASSKRPLNQRVSDITPLLKLSSLNRLELAFNNISKLPSDMSGLSNLTEIILEGNGSMAKDNKNFDSSLYPSGKTGLTDISPLGSLTKLTKLNAMYADVTSLKGLEGLTKIQELRVEHNKIRSLEPIKSMLETTLLTVDSNLITDISPLANLNKLKEVHLANNNYNTDNRLGADPKPMDVSALKGKSSLTYLDIANNAVADISVISNLSALKHLDVHRNKITDLSPISNLKNLTKLDAQDQRPASTNVTRYDSNNKTRIDISKLKDVKGKAVTLAKNPLRTYANGAWTVVPSRVEGNELVIDSVYSKNLSVFYTVQGLAGEKESQVDAIATAAPTPAPVPTPTPSPTTPKPTTPAPTPSPTTPKPTTPAPTPSPTTPRPTTPAPTPSPTTPRPTTPALTPSPVTTRFTDVPNTRQFATEINWLATTGITTGYADGTFRPAASVNRDAMAAFFYRMAGSPAYTAPAVSPFKDVPTTHQFYKEISWLASKGISTGYADGTFRPSQPITRDAMAAFFYRMDGKPAYTAPATAKFADVPTSHQFYKEVSWFATKGITTGYADGTFRPANSITRDAMAAFIYRYKR